VLAAAWRAWLRNTPCRSRFPERDAIYGEIRAVRDEPIHGPFDGFGHILRPIDGPGDHPNSEPVRRSNIVRGQLRDDSVSFTPASRRSTGSIDGLRSARSGIAKATRAPRPTKAKTSKLDVLGAKRRKTRRGVKQLTHFRRCGIYLIGLVGARPKGGLRWVSRKRPNPVGVQECEASSNAHGHAVAQCFHPGDAKSPEPRGMRRSRWPIVSLASIAKPSHCP